MVNRLTEEDELNKLRDTISFLCINLFFFYDIFICFVAVHLQALRWT